MRQPGIYRIRNVVNNNAYIGSSVDIKGRWRSHKNELRRNKHHSPYLQNSWNNHSEDSFVFEILESCERDKVILKEREQHYIDTLKPVFNHLKAAYSVLGYKHTDETKKFISETHKGREFSEEYRAKLSAAAKGKPKSEAHRKKLSECNVGNKNALGHKVSEESKIKMAWNKGGQHSESTKKKMSEVRRGKLKSPEWRQKIAESVKQRWESKRNESQGTC